MYAALLEKTARVAADRQFKKQSIPPRMEKASVVPDVVTVAVAASNLVASTSATEPPPKKPRANSSKYALIQLPSDSSDSVVFQQLMDAGFTSVSFLNSIMEHKEVQDEMNKLKANISSSSASPVASPSPVPTNLVRLIRKPSNSPPSLSRSTPAEDIPPPTMAVVPQATPPPIDAPKRNFQTFRDRIKSRMELKNQDEDIIALSIIEGVPLAAPIKLPDSGVLIGSSSMDKEPKKEPEDELFREVKQETPNVPLPTPGPSTVVPTSVASVTPGTARYVFKNLHSTLHSPRPFPRLMDERLERALPNRQAPPAILPQPKIQLTYARGEEPSREKAVPQRVPGQVFRRDYKNPPLPLPADDGTHVKCHLCDNRIMVSRLSNLTNHVRRHSAMKQYQCVHCNYQHNEQAKVRLHMTNNHSDTVSIPKDNLDKNMQKMWAMLMEECFPGYLDQLKPTASDWQRHNVVQSQMDCGVATLDTLHSCTDCGDAVTVSPNALGNKSTEPLVEHIRTSHMELCVAQKCQECGYMNADEWKVRWHISARHAEKACDVQVEPEPVGKHMSLFLYKFFPSVEKLIGKRVDKEEEALNKAIEQEKRLGMKEEGLQKPPVVTDDEDESRPPSIPSLSDIVKVVDTSDEIYGEPKVDRSLLGPDVVLCELCNKILDFSNKNTLCSLLAHAKRHYRIKQFQCPRCSYASSESAHIRSHLLGKHDSQERPKEYNDEKMQAAWLRVMKQCFPELKDRIDNFRFKTGKSWVPMESQESATNQPPVHNYSTRRKRNFFA